MSKKDFFFIVIVVLALTPFFISKTVFNYYVNFNANHSIVTSFFKFAILATVGELIGLRIKEGNYYKKDFGLVPKMVVWGFLGVTVKFAFIIFSTGVPIFLEYTGLNEIGKSLSEDFSVKKLFAAFCISFFLNIVYAPMLMITHSVTNAHISNFNGKLISLVKPIPVLAILKKTDWNVLWGFVIMKTIPLFWIPAQTITFLLPHDFQILFAALLSIVLGVILAVSALKSQK